MIARIAVVAGEVTDDVTSQIVIIIQAEADAQLRDAGVVDRSHPGRIEYTLRLVTIVQRIAQRNCRHGSGGDLKITRLQDRITTEPAHLDIHQCRTVRIKRVAAR